MSGPADTPEDDDALAAEFALRLLDGPEAEAAQRRAAVDPAFAGRVAYWNARFADLAEETAPAAPGEAAKRDLMARLFARGAPPGAETVRAGVAAWWRWLGLAGTAAALVLAALLVLAPRAGPTGPVYVTELVSQDGSFRYLAVIDTDRETIRLVRTDGEPPASGSMELWGHGPGEPPVSFGVIPAGERATLPVPEVLKPQSGQLIFGVSNEPEGGSPTGQPTGAVLASGESTDL